VEPHRRFSCLTNETRLTVFPDKSDSYVTQVVYTFRNPTSRDRDPWLSSPAPTWDPMKFCQLLVRAAWAKSTVPVILNSVASESVLGEDRLRKG
jgi:hypothetical protein